MIGVVNGKVYNTEISEKLHEMDAGRWDGSTRALYVSPNGRFFYVYSYPNGQTMIEVLGEGVHAYDGTTEVALGKPHDSVSLAIRWLEFHGGHEAILERWPERLGAG